MSAKKEMPTWMTGSIFPFIVFVALGICWRIGWDGILGLRYLGQGPDRVTVQDIVTKKAREGDYVTVQGNVWSEFSHDFSQDHLVNGHTEYTHYYQYNLLIDPTDSGMDSWQKVFATNTAIQKLTLEDLHGAARKAEIGNRIHEANNIANNFRPTQCVLYAARMSGPPSPPAPMDPSNGDALAAAKAFTAKLASQWQMASSVTGVIKELPEYVGTQYKAHPETAGVGRIYIDTYDVPSGAKGLLFGACSLLVLVSGGLFLYRVL